MLLIAVALMGLAFACGGGGGGSTPSPTQTPTPTETPGEPGNPVFSVVLTANPDQGPAPLLVNFSAYAYGGAAPYTYEWDFNADGVFESNMVNPYYRFDSSAVVKLQVTDANGDVVTATRSITITAGGEPSYGVAPLEVKYTVSATSGTAPLTVEFEAIATGGRPPYSYSWDFEGDGIPDSFSQHVIYTYSSPGPNPDPTGHPGEHYYSPSLTVSDNRGVQVSTLDDRDGDGEADWIVKVNVTPPSALSPYIRANPPTGQAPLSVEFMGGASGGEPPYEFKWDFGDSEVTDWSPNAVIDHIYLDAGTYLVRLTVKDAQETTDTSGPVMVTVSTEPTFNVRIEADVTEGPVPLNVQMTAFTEGGKQPVSYNWQVFTDIYPQGSEPMIVDPPAVPAPLLDSNAVVVPSTTSETNPVITFATYVGEQVQVNRMGTASTVAIPNPYVVRLIATDANGVQAFSNLIRISPQAPQPASLYSAFRYPKAADSVFSPGTSSAFTARSNSAVAVHPSGMVFLFGGEKVNSAGEFEGLVNQLDAAWALNISGTDRSSALSDRWSFPSGGWTQLNTLQGPPYPFDAAGNPTVANPPSSCMSCPSEQPCPRCDHRMGNDIQRSEPFVNRGSAAGTLIHEPWDGNPGGYGAPPG
ncbi:MAG: hypothetical protein B1H03_01460 [Planctomycetales bacterium 4484_113]|nr:MAG: hypothetical protein B1H03_01460 [Planctomycetales bacterium 4484_113]